MNYLQRYQSGERESVWNALVGLKEAGRSAGEGVVREFVRRASHNLSRIRQFLEEAGYQFANPDFVMVPSSDDTMEEIQEIEKSIGALPLVLKFFWETIESVDFALVRDISPEAIAPKYRGLEIDDSLYILSPQKALPLARSFLMDLKEHNESIRKAYAEQPELAELGAPLLNEIDEGFLPLGPFASNCERKGVSLPCTSIDCRYFDDGGGPWSLADEMRSWYESCGFGLHRVFGHRERRKQRQRAQELREEVRPGLLPL